MTHTSPTVAMTDRDFEQVVLCRDPGAGLESVIAIHDTTLGPSLGGIRMRAYPDPDAAVADALNLAQAMTYKAALAGLALGGGKSVINADPTAPNRRELLTAHARYINSLAGRYIPAVDMGTTVTDLELVGQYVPRVSSQRRDPSSFTAQGVVAAIRAAVRVSEDTSLAGVRVAVQGLGHVGRLVVGLLTREGAQVLVSDIDARPVAAVVAETGATAVPIDDVLVEDVDVVCPCATGGVITEPVLEQLKARYVIGAANNVLADAPGLADQLAQRGVIHVPDFVANAGGLIACEAEIRGGDTDLADRVEGIGTTTHELLQRAGAERRSTVAVAVELAQARLDQRRAQRPYFATR
ncbi:valine dehydrogenase [Pseudonocardia kujensis]|uniref:Glu/Leu/Phe/Val dehydrogenase family protein n=1 Tax=Pseudonocardia kujensis TaxID=1128675 RepID=UPI001E4361B3|nr:Glu/Leu/Phe/Val dehydrogenase family protein [Pseudonocardia kujensis]MCE0763278.1 valine dehydrogenase [Pseudonocardia kujensis]